MSRIVKNTACEGSTIDQGRGGERKSAEPQKAPGILSTDSVVLLADSLGGGQTDKKRPRQTVAAIIGGL